MYGATPSSHSSLLVSFRTNIEEISSRVTMAIVLRVRKMLLVIWKFAYTKKKRTPSLQDCMEDSPPKDVVSSFRPWLLTVLGLALVYNLLRLTSHVSLIYITYNSSDQTKNEDIQVPRSVSSAAICGRGCNLEEVSNKTKTKISDLRVPYGIPRPPKVQCKMNKLPQGRISQLDSSYSAKIKLGGYYKPIECVARDKVAIIVPYRDRETNLIVFLYNIHPFLIDQKLEYRIFVIEQIGHEKFNKGRLCNAGFDQAHRFGNWRCVVFHNVNLLPLDNRIFYTCPTDPTQMSVNITQFNKVSPHESHFGGVIAMTGEHFKKVNGYSNLYWGSADVDLDMCWRMRAADLPIKRYDQQIGKYTMLPHPKEKNPKRHEVITTGIKKNRYKTDGVSNSHYEIISIKLRSLYTHIVVDINPNKESTE